MLKGLLNPRQLDVIVAFGARSGSLQPALEPGHHRHDFDRITTGTIALLLTPDHVHVGNDAV